MGSRSRSARIYVGNLPPDIRVSDVKELFDPKKYGKILDVDLKNEKGPPFAFVEFENKVFSVPFFSIKNHFTPFLLVSYSNCDSLRIACGKISD